VSTSWFETVDSEVLHDGFSKVRRDQVRTPGGHEVEREIVEHLDAVAIVPVMDDGSVLLLRQYRHPLGRYLLEIPAGLLDVEGESPAEAAQRELIEEVGHRADELTELVRFQNSAGWTDEHTTVYLARGLHATEPPEEFEPHAEEADMEVVRLPLTQAIEQAERGSITDAKTLIGLLLARAHA
jgi:8-oxo-dGDP phosphatase